MIVAAFAARRKLAGGFAFGILLGGAATAATAAVSTLPPALILLGLAGAASILLEVNAVTLVQRSADNEVLGRVFAVLETLILGSMAIGCLVAPALVAASTPNASGLVPAHRVKPAQVGVTPR